jgi:hypothetical protein
MTETRTARLASVVTAVKNAIETKFKLVALRAEDAEACHKTRFVVCSCGDHADAHIHVPLRPRR